MGSQLLVSLSALSAGQAVLPRHILSPSGTDFCQRPSESYRQVRLKGLDKVGKKVHYLIGSRTRHLPASNIVPQPLRYCVPPLLWW
jgi:hypothetical protein